MIVSLLPAPALLIRMSAPPSSFSAASTIASTPAGVATSAASATTFTSAAALISARAAARRSPSRAAMSTCTPSPASALATARPIPTLPPLITATLSRNPRSILSPLHGLLDDRDLAPVDGHNDRQNQDRAEDDLLCEDVDADE